MGILSFILIIPLISLVALLVASEKHSRRISIAGNALTLLTSLGMLMRFNLKETGLQFEENYPWISSLDINFHIGVDHLSILFVVLTSLICFLALLSSFDIKKFGKVYYSCFLLLLSSMIGVFVSFDLFLFYVFWEFSLFPLYIIIALWGGKNRIYAAIKMFLYTLFGSIFLLTGIILVYIFATPHSFDLLKVIANAHTISAPFPLIIVILFSIGFAVKLPIVPFHTWLPDAHVEAPTAGSMILAGIVLKMGGYGFLRLVMGVFPSAAQNLATTLAVLAIISILYGAFLALAQTDLKKLVAYSSISHMGFVLLGIASMTHIGFSGAIFQMIAHGLSSAALFFIVGILYLRTNTREINGFGGLASIMPCFSILFSIIAFGSLGLPGLAGFVGEFSSLTGGYEKFGWIAGIGALGIFIAAMYMLKMLQSVLWGKPRDDQLSLNDLSMTEKTVLGTLVFFTILGGILPNIFLRFIEAGTDALSQLY